MKKISFPLCTLSIILFCFLHCQKEQMELTPVDPDPVDVACKSPEGSVSGGSACCKHTDCESGLCNIDQVPVDPKDATPRTCVPQSLVYVIKPPVDAYTSSGQGTVESPFASMSQAIAPGTLYKPYKVVYGQSVPGFGSHNNERLTFADGKKHVIIGIPSLDKRKPQLFDISLQKGTSVTLDQVNLDGSTSGDFSNTHPIVGQGIICDQGQVQFLRSSMQNQEMGIWARSCPLVVDQSSFFNTGSKGILFNVDTAYGEINASYQITNSIFTYNSGNFGIFVEPQPESVFAFNLFIHNQEISEEKLYFPAIRCNPHMTLHHSIIVQNGMKSTQAGIGKSQFQNCQFDHVVVGEDDVVGKDPNLFTTGQVIPILPDYDTEFHLLDTPKNRQYLIDQVNPGSISIPPVDFYGVPRPQHGKLDIGHAELLQNSNETP